MEAGSPDQAIFALSDAFSVLRRCGVIRSTRLVGDLGEWYVATLYDGVISQSQAQKGWDILEKSSGQKLQVKTQTFDSKNQWNYLTTSPDFFDRLIIVLLTDTFLVRDMYDIPSIEVGQIICIGKEKKPRYRFKDLSPWRVDISTLPGHSKLGRTSQAYL
jgi:hypothetical protein